MQDELLKTSERYPHAIARLRGEELPDRSVEAVEAEIESCLLLISELLRLEEEAQLLAAFQQATFELGRTSREGDSKQLFTEADVAKERLEGLQRQIEEMKENHADTIARLHMLWAVRESVEAADPLLSP